MARIALRAYNREIEHLIEGGQIEEAIAHCRHILKYFPKHINTYRLLGKAYLETQRYGDAADILQRMLSSIPDDFISHLGMSIIREDEGNLDEAIWHMERAFEVQPANRAIQDELRRLYGRRDGLEPPKIRLTRGALARMYAKGDLYPQAIAELRAALAEDPQRLDLQVVLADVYARAGQRVEAASICNGLLRKLPYCLVANEVMADILADSERAEDARVYRQRAQALDAYLAHTSPGAPTPDKVPDIAVTLERLVWQPGKSIEGAGQPDWAASLGVELESSATQKEEIPDWLSAVQADTSQAGLPSGSEANAPFTPEAEAGADWMEELNQVAAEWSQGPSPDAAQPTSEEEIPEWMKAAGWSPSTGEAEEEPVEFDFKEEEYTGSQPEGELEEADLPDWLREVAPENLDQDSPTGEEDSGWDQGLSEDAAILESTPDWFKDADSEETEKEESPDWLADLAGVAAVSALEEIKSEPDEDLPDWLQEMGAEAGKAQEDETPAWLQESEPEAELETLTGVETPEDISTADELPDWLIEAETEEALSPTSEVEAEPADEVPDWMKEMGAGAGASMLSELEADVEAEPAEELPDWLKELEPEETSVPTSLPEGLEALEAEMEAAEGTPDLLEEMEAEASETIIAEPEKMTAPEPAEELPDWLEVSQLEEIEPESSIKEEAIPVEEVPDWLVDLPADEVSGAVADELAEVAAGTDIEIEPGEEVEAETLFEEGMTFIAAAEETAEEELDVEETGMRALEEEIEPEDQEAFPAAGQEEVSPEAASASGDMDAVAAFAWLEGLAARQGADEEGLLLSPEERTETPPDWVKSAMVAEAESVDHAEGVSEAMIEETSELEEISTEHELAVEAESQETLEQAKALPDWLQEIEDTAAEEGITGEEPLPDWLTEAGEFYQEESAGPEEEIQPAEEFPEWLRSVQMEEEEAQPKAVAAEELPDWLREMPEEVEEAPAGEPQEDWLAELEEPIIEGDTKPTRLILESHEEQISAPEDSSTSVFPSGEVEEELPFPEAEIQEPELEVPAEPSTADEAYTDAEADFAWLESLAAKQGVDEGMLLAPEERLESPPEWIQSALDKQFGEEAQEIADEAIELVEEQDVVEAGQRIIEELAEEPEQVEESPELPDWLIDMEAEAESDETAEVIDAIAESTEVAGEEEIPELPTWLEETEEKEEPAWIPPEPVVQKLDLNQASLAELERLPGIGFIMAQQIVTYRDENGPFSDLTDLEQIPGFNSAMLGEIEDRIMVEAAKEEPLALPVEAETPPELVAARQAALGGSLDEALEKYTELILQKKSLEEVIYDINQILLRHEGEAAAWQTLGDAQMRANLVQEALDSYMRAEQLFR